MSDTESAVIAKVDETITNLTENTAWLDDWKSLLRETLSSYLKTVRQSATEMHDEIQRLREVIGPGVALERSNDCEDEGGAGAELLEGQEQSQRRLNACAFNHSSAFIGAINAYPSVGNQFADIVSRHATSVDRLEMEPRALGETMDLYNTMFEFMLGVWRRLDEDQRLEAGPRAVGAAKTLATNLLYVVHKTLGYFEDNGHPDSKVDQTMLAIIWFDMNRHSVLGMTDNMSVFRKVDVEYVAALVSTIYAQTSAKAKLSNASYLYLASTRISYRDVIHESVYNTVRGWEMHLGEICKIPVQAVTSRFDLGGSGFVPGADLWRVYDTAADLIKAQRGVFTSFLEHCADRSLVVKQHSKDFWGEAFRSVDMSSAAALPLELLARCSDRIWLRCTLRFTLLRTTGTGQEEDAGAAVVAALKSQEPAFWKGVYSGIMSPMLVGKPLADVALEVDRDAETGAIRLSISIEQSIPTLLSNGVSVDSLICGRNLRHSGDTSRDYENAFSTQFGLRCFSERWTFLPTAATNTSASPFELPMISMEQLRHIGDDQVVDRITKAYRLEIEHARVILGEIQRIQTDFEAFGSTYNGIHGNTAKYLMHGENNPTYADVLVMTETRSDGTDRRVRFSDWSSHVLTLFAKTDSFYNIGPISQVRDFFHANAVAVLRLDSTFFYNRWTHNLFKDGFEEDATKSTVSVYEWKNRIGPYDNDRNRFSICMGAAILDVLSSRSAPASSPPGPLEGTPALATAFFHIRQIAMGVRRTKSVFTKLYEMLETQALRQMRSLKTNRGAISNVNAMKHDIKRLLEVVAFVDAQFSRQHMRVVHACESFAGLMESTIASNRLQERIETTMRSIHTTFSDETVLSFLKAVGRVVGEFEQGQNIELQNSKLHEARDWIGTVCSDSFPFKNILWVENVVGGLSPVVAAWVSSYDERYAPHVASALVHVGMVSESIVCKSLGPSGELTTSEMSDFDGSASNAAIENSIKLTANQTQEDRLREEEQQTDEKIIYMPLRWFEGEANTWETKRVDAGNGLLGIIKEYAGLEGAQLQNGYQQRPDMPSKAEQLAILEGLTVFENARMLYVAQFENAHGVLKWRGGELPGGGTPWKVLRRRWAKLYPTYLNVYSLSIKAQYALVEACVLKGRRSGVAYKSQSEWIAKLKDLTETLRNIVAALKNRSDVIQEFRSDMEQISAPESAFSKYTEQLFRDFTASVTATMQRLDYHYHGSSNGMGIPYKELEALLEEHARAYAQLQIASTITGAVSSLRALLEFKGTSTGVLQLNALNTTVLLARADEYTNGSSQSV